MKPPARPVEEARRLEALQQYDLLDTMPEQVLDDLTLLASEICEAPISLISLIDDQRQWFKSRVGLSVTETPREISFCGHTILQRELFIVADSYQDQRFADNPLVTGEPHIRFYAAAPLINLEGQAIGTLCVIDRVPRQLSAFQLRALAVLGRQAMAQLELRRRTRDLAKSERLLLTIFDSEPECVKLLDPEGSLRMMNRAGLAMIEADSFEQVDGRYLHSLVTPEHQSRFKALTARVLRGDSGTMEFQIVGLKGAARWLETHAAPLRDERGDVIGLLGVTRDITGRRKLEEQLRHSQKMEAIGTLAGGVAHDFNNILAVIHGYGSLLMSGQESPRGIAEAAEQIVQASERAANLTRQLLAFGRRQLMQPRILDLNDVIAGSAKMLRRVLDESVRLELRLQPHALWLSADAGMLDQVLMNLVVNARDAMPGGGHLVIATTEMSFTADEACALPEAKPGRYACLRVTDSGSGISPADLASIFEPFFTTKEAGKGTGLGLATVFGIVKQHDGFLRVASEVGQGTTFEVLLPAAETGRLTDEAASQPTPSGGTETILLVEDDAAVRRLTRAVLEQAGYQVLEACNGVEALQVWEAHPHSVDLLFTDMVMPGGVSGRELVTRLQAQNPTLRVVFTSGYSAEIGGKGLLLREGENFVQKPSSPPQILSTVRRCLDR